MYHLYMDVSKCYIIVIKSMEIAEISGTEIIAAAMESSGIPTELEFKFYIL